MLAVKAELVKISKYSFDRQRNAIERLAAFLDYVEALGLGKNLSWNQFFNKNLDLFSVEAAQIELMDQVSHYGEHYALKSH